MSVVGENKWRWETTSDDEGEFALHVPEDAVYVLRVDAKGYQTFSEDVDASQTDRVDLAVHLVSVGGGK
jgi:Carboxypeptidase regulatory-like domain